MQLYAKAVYYELLGDYPRGHRIKEVISILIKELRVKEFQEEVGAYTLSRYGDVEFSVEDSKEVVNVASQLTELLEEVYRIVKLG
jgi:HEPN domain-containing protein